MEKNGILMFNSDIVHARLRAAERFMNIFPLSLVSMVS